MLSALNEHREGGDGEGESSVYKCFPNQSRSLAFPNLAFFSIQTLTMEFFDLSLPVAVFYILSGPKPVIYLISFRIDWFDLLAVKGLSRVFSNTAVQKHQFFSANGTPLQYSCLENPMDGGAW